MAHARNCKQKDVVVLNSGWLAFTLGLENLYNIDTGRRDHPNPDQCNVCLSLRDNWFGEWRGRQVETRTMTLDEA